MAVAIPELALALGEAVAPEMAEMAVAQGGKALASGLAGASTLASGAYAGYKVGRKAIKEVGGAVKDVESIYKLGQKAHGLITPKTKEHYKQPLNPV